MQFRLGQRARLALAAAYMLVLVPLGLWPFAVQRPCDPCRNEAKIVPGVGLVFPRAGIVLDPGAGDLLYRALAPGREITVAVAAESAAARQSGPARILSHSGGTLARNVTLAQEGRDLVFRLRTPATGENGTDPAVVAPDAIDPGRTQVFVATYDGRQARIFVDGDLVAERTLGGGGFSGWDPGFPLILGNELTGDRGWTGTLRDAAVYASALSQRQAAALRPEALASAAVEPIYRLRQRCTLEAPPVSGTCERPPVFHDARRAVRPLSTAPRRASDAAQNAALYAPLGALLLGAGVSPRLGVIAFCVAALHALSLEAAQVAVIGRTSSARDLASAWIGLATGAMLLGLVREKGAKRR